MQQLWCYALGVTTCVLWTLNSTLLLAFPSFLSLLCSGKHLSLSLRSWCCLVFLALSIFSMWVLFQIIKKGVYTRLNGKPRIQNACCTKRLPHRFHAVPGLTAIVSILMRNEPVHSGRQSRHLKSPSYSRSSPLSGLVIKWLIWTTTYLIGPVTSVMNFCTTTKKDKERCRVVTFTPLRRWRKEFLCLNAS